MGLGAIEIGSAGVAELAEAEVYRWYDLFFAWSRGTIPKSRQHIEPLFSAFAPDFRVVLTDGRLMDRDAYCDRLWGLYGVRAGSPRSEIIGLSIKTVSANHALAVFDLIKDGIPKKKVDSALLRRELGSPLGVSWVYVHESEHGLQ